MSMELTWFKSSYSGPEGGDCVEVAVAPTTVHIRDSKNAQGPILHIPTAPWTAFTAFAATQPTTPA
ncbi:DUF397 domain-containing protein [Streptomyces sp. 35G-GA-8]|uniref:DUF397 domain-containing protein n=1 Tax=Streptomyces sp. 35G-GA-8 TaxID=2939434 RepID=UPI00201F5812|nr:DUF397 domain-containing protein [Streptomyces sp. 35G-GA-8]MCL7382057.1 DUF397 domain-containing protein [Streptomyces sp. 35G-GA-8]